MAGQIVVINTLVFLEDLNNGVKQSDLLEDIHSLGVNKVEIRREFIKNFETELKEIRDISERLQMEIYYSVPGYLYVGGKLNTCEIELSFKEAYKMNCRYVKFNIGDYKHITSENVYMINTLCDRYSIKLTIENDQTKENGQVQKIKEFLKAAEKLHMSISCTFDIGNWLWQKEDPKENAYILKPYVTYVHLKDVYMKEKLEATSLDGGIIPWKSILDVFNINVPIAIEYPCYPDTLVMLKKEVDKLKM
ncbi:MAG TPA: TIM barrel protein [Clostridium sp.]|uniref:sugar phosphate isomerase/epimerase family protein n=1 Tax=Clostridium sp. TaxID=1506 RepID=UPI002F92CDEC